MSATIKLELRGHPYNSDFCCEERLVDVVREVEIEPTAAAVAEVVREFRSTFGVRKVTVKER